MTSRERILTSLNHREPDRIPIDLSGHRSSGIAAIAYARLREHLGLPPKPIRVFLQDGDKDLDNVWGNWWLANLQMEAALKFKKYDYKFVGGTGGHSGQHGGAILPDSLCWLWRAADP